MQNNQLRSAALFITIQRAVVSHLIKDILAPRPKESSCTEGENQLSPTIQNLSSLSVSSAGSHESHRRYCILSFLHLK